MFVPPLSYRIPQADCDWDGVYLSPLEAFREPLHVTDIKERG